MPYVYTGTLSDVGLEPIADLFPVMQVRPEREAFGPDGLVSAVPVTVPVNAAGEFSMTLAASSELVPETGYIISVGRFEETLDGNVFRGFDSWRFDAWTGGGPVTEQNGSPYPVFIGPPVKPWPANTPDGLYIQAVAPNAWGIKKSEGV